MGILLFTLKMSCSDQLQLNFFSVTCFVHQTGSSIICPSLQERLDTQQAEMLIL